MAFVHCKLISGVLNMNAAGIDVSSRKSTVAVLRPFGEVVRIPFEVSHSAEGLASLVQQLKAIEGENRVVMEHTGRYYEAVANVLHEAGFFVSAVNPLLIKEYGGNSLRKVKTDKADAVKIARYALDNWANLRDYTPMDRIRYDLKNSQSPVSSGLQTENRNLQQPDRPAGAVFLRRPQVLRQPGPQRRNPEVGGLCPRLLARRLCPKTQPGYLYRTLPQMVQAPRLQLQAEHCAGSL